MIRTQRRWFPLYLADLFVPTDIDNCYLWLDANDRSTLFQDTAFTTRANNTDVVGGWIDKTGNGHNATQATVANKPTRHDGILNSKPIVRFDGTNDYMEFLSWDAMPNATVFLVLIATNCNLYRGPINWMVNGSAGWQVCTHVDNTWQTNLVTWNGAAETANKLSNSDIEALPFTTIETVTFASTPTITDRRNGAALVLGNTPAGFTRVANPRIGHAFAYIGADFGEVIIYNRVLIASEILTVEGYLNGKWVVY